MPRLTKKQILQHARKAITKYFDENPAQPYSLDEVTQIFWDNKERWLLASTTKLNEFLAFLLEREILFPIEIKTNRKPIYRFIHSDISPFQIPLSIYKKSYLTHYSAIFLHGLSDNLPKTIYANVEQTQKPVQSSYDMVQQAIDSAFSHPMRKTSNIGRFKLNTIAYETVLINGRFTNRRAVIEMEHEGVSLAVTDLERTLIEIVTRPDYSGGIGVVAEAFKRARDKVQISRLVALLKEMKFVYPYQQAIGFYMDAAGYTKSQIKLLSSMVTPLNFYLGYQIKDKAFSKDWKIYYPESLFSHIQGRKSFE